MEMTEQANQVISRPVQQLSLWSIGAGFEGTASDWTEYVVWLVSFISLVWFIWSRNVMALPDIDLADLRLDGEDGDAEADEDDADGKENEKPAEEADEGCRVRKAADKATAKVHDED
mmetsp:Transcript_68814/g.165182  ORF Transcript_68814/g.165182 Transcript_68814/m.165182 type:complete len:117 (+) Transcript_68814:69-419(+)